jgi:phosphoribosylformylglycinamidine cyclo-ligase
LEPEFVTTIIKGICEGCRQSACALIGGETAEMRDVYRAGDFDLAGFVVGLVDKDKVITGRGITVGDKIVRLPSSGVHSNGYSLARKVSDLIEDPTERLAFKKDLLVPTVIYVKQVLDLISRFSIKGIANITGGGLYENIARVLPKNVDARVDFGSWELLPVFKTLQRVGNISWREMCSAFNVGVGMTLVLDPATATALCSAEPTLDIIGEIIPGSGEVVVEGLPQS